jgi:NAD(P)-dependent dehydrogenase (short-subunit alcohol dehydrogenase family)
MGLLDQKSAIITGGGTGIGLAIAKRFHEEGANVVICGRRMDKISEAVKKISQNGEGVYAVQADVTVEDDIKKIAEVTTEKTGRIDILVNNAGTRQYGRLEEINPQIWDVMMNTNARAPWRLMVAVLPGMRKVGGGSIINISSIAGTKAYVGNGIYGTSKAALQHLSQVMAMEMASENIRVNVISASVVEDTEIFDEVLGSETTQRGYVQMQALHPLGRNGKPKDIADAAFFLASDQSLWITGITLSVDGGRNIATNNPVSMQEFIKEGLRGNP